MTQRNTRRRTSRSTVSRARPPTLWRQHLISGSVTTGQSNANLSPVAQTTTARPIKLLRSIVEITCESGIDDETIYFGTTLVTVDALTALTFPDTDADPGHPWHWWETVQLYDGIKVIKELLVRTARIVRPDFRYVIVIDGDNNNSGAVNFDVKLRLLWQL